MLQTGIEPESLVWKAGVMTTIPHTKLFTYPVWKKNDQKRSWTKGEDWDASNITVYARYTQWEIFIDNFNLYLNPFTHLHTVLLSIFGWQISHGHKRWIFLDNTCEFSWTLLVNSHGYFVCENSPWWILGPFVGEFSWTFS